MDFSFNLVTLVETLKMTQTWILQCSSWQHSHCEVIALVSVVCTCLCFQIDNQPF